MTTSREQVHRLVQATRVAALQIAILAFMVRILRKIFRRIYKKRLFIEQHYGTLPKLFPKRNPHLLRMPKSDLVAEVRRFWFNNVAGIMRVDGHTISRRDIAVYGGPEPCLTHPVSQRMEWLSRIKQTDLFEPHDSPQAEQCRILCKRQGDECWTHHQQNFNFALGNNPALTTPKCLCILPKGHVKAGPYERFLTPRCDQWNLVLKRRLARSCQIDVATYLDGVDSSKYDLMFIVNTARNRRFSRPDIPVILYGHDMWPDDPGYQWVIDWLQPDVLLVPFPTPWRANFRLPGRTRVVFSPFAPSLFFTRPNLYSGDKQFDLLVIGKLSGARGSWIYAPRAVLNDKIHPLTRRYNIEFSHNVGALRNFTNGGTLEERPEGPVRYLNQWSAYLGSAKYVIFGRLASRVHQFVLGKYYETLASGAIPIFPEVPDLKLLGVAPFEHYIPLSEVEGRNDRLIHFLDHYEDYRYIAQNAVEWSTANMDRMLFDDFESLIHEITGRRFPKRLID